MGRCGGTSQTGQTGQMGQMRRMGNGKPRFRIPLPQTGSNRRESGGGRVEPVDEDVVFPVRYEISQFRRL